MIIDACNHLFPLVDTESGGASIDAVPLDPICFLLPKKKENDVRLKLHIYLTAYCH